ncbi:MAG: hypothetical protein RSB35_10905, partial [Eubacterium sp.]
PGTHAAWLPRAFVFLDLFLGLAYNERVKFNDAIKIKDYEFYEWIQKRRERCHVHDEDDS